MKIIIPLFKLFPQKLAYAHCDIPCGIYDPNNAQLAAHTIIRMTELLGEVKRDNETKAEHDIARITKIKENHSDILEHEIFTLRYDYFKDEQLKEYPNLEDLFQKALKSITKSRTGIDMESAEETLETVLQFSEIFYKSKKVTPVRIKSVYPTKREIVTYK